MIPDDTFIRLVIRMREAQKSYFRTKSQSALTEAKHLEAQVDALLPAMPRVQQGGLW